MTKLFRGSWVLVAVLVAGLVGCATNTGEKTGAYVDDSWITSKVKSEMIADKEVSGTKIHVDTTKGVVTLSGTAATPHEADKAVAIARNVKGVTDVENNIRVQ